MTYTTPPTADFDRTLKMIYQIHDTIDCYEITATAERSYIIFSRHDFWNIMGELEQNENYYCSGTEIKISIMRTSHTNDAGFTADVTKCCVEFVN